MKQIILKCANFYEHKFLFEPIVNNERLRIIRIKVIQPIQQTWKGQEARAALYSLPYSY